MNVFRTHRGIAWFYACILILISILYIFKPAGYENIRSNVNFLYFLIPSCLLALHYWIAVSCKRGEQRGRIVSIIISCLMLPMTPIGFIIGIWLLFNTWQPFTKIDT